MCGISGFVVVRDANRQDVVEQLRLLHHRGPDADGYFGGRSAVIAQNRLAVIDLSTGDPPITNEDRTIGVALNGEIYNFLALQERLRRDGHRFRSTGDTEVIAHLAEQHHGTALAEQLEGMFAFAVWDERHQRLTLGRDRLGK